MDAWLDSKPGRSLCRCPECFGLAEYMLERTGKDYGLPRALGHAPAPVKKPEPEPIPARRPAAAQPWEPRPSRHSKKAA